MPIDYLTHVKPLEDAGLADAEIASNLAGSGVTRNVISIGEAQAMLIASGLDDVLAAAAEDADGSLSAITITTPDGGTLALPEACRKLLKGLAAERLQTLDTTTSTYAGLVKFVTSGLVGAGRIAPEAAADLYALGGGEVFAGVAETDVVESRSAHARRAAASAANTTNAEAASKARQINQLSIRDDSVAPVTLPIPDAPEGYHFDAAGMLAEDA